MKTPFLAHALAFLGALGLAQAAAPRYTLIPLEDLGGGFSQANAINASGQMAGNSYDTENLGQGALWSRDGKLAYHGSLPGTGDLCFAFAIDAAGQLAGSSNATASGNLRAILVPAGGAMATLGSLTAPSAPAANQGDYLAGYLASEARGINKSGAVVGYSYVGSENRAFIWTAAGGMVALPAVAGVPYSAAAAINDQGVVVGATSSSSNFVVRRAVRWLPGSHGVRPPPAELGTLGGSGSEATAINGSGQIVGVSRPAGDATKRAFLYDEKATPKMRELGDLPSGTDSYAAGINDSGQVVGTVSDNNGSRVFLYTGGTLYDLDDLVPNSGWTDTEATGINAAGEICGYGTAPDGTTQLGFLLRPVKTVVPPPAPAARPAVKITGAKKLTTAKAKVTIKGKATGQVTSVTAKIGRKTVKARGTASWSLKAALKPGKNKITAIAHGPGGDSAPARLTVTRKP